MKDNKVVRYEMCILCPYCRAEFWHEATQQNCLKCPVCGRKFETVVEDKSALQKQEGGNHYKQLIIQPIEFITKNNLGFCEGNVIKYICRHRKKGGIEDLKKAKHYIELLAELEYGEKI